MKRAVFLDRDGVLNRTIDRGAAVPGSPRTLDELEIMPGAPLALQRLRQAGFLLICITNQPELARREVQPDVLAQMHAALRRDLPLDDVLTCPHDDAAGCQCRKPKAGL